MAIRQFGQKEGVNHRFSWLLSPFVVIDRGYRIVAANASYRKHYGCTEEDIVGRYCYDVSHHSAVPCNKHGEHCPMEAVFGQRQTTQVMHVHYDKHGKIESELFGHEKGAFTGASSRKKGLFEAANGGTLFIDEICELPLPLQTKLLRALETGTLRRLGGTEYIKVNVRIIAATNQDMQRMVEHGEFRQDLYYRLSTFPVNVPPLREHKDDIPALAEHFLSQLKDGDRHIPLASEVIEALLGYDYPGNVRELRNVIERGAILAGEGMIRPDHLVFEGPRMRDDVNRSGPPRHSELFDRRHGRLTDEQVIGALEHCNGHRASAAHQLGVSERTLYRYVQKLRSNARVSRPPPRVIPPLAD